VPTEPHTDTDPQRYLLSTVRQSQAAVIDTIRTWTAITEQLARTLRVPVPEVDFAGAVDRVFDVAEQTLAVQRQLALTAAGIASRQVDTALETADTAVAAVETTVGKGVRRVEDLVEAVQGEQEQPDPEQPQAPKAESPTQLRKFDGRTYEERTLDELRERAAELQLEGHSAMNKEELIAALRDHRKQRSAKNDASTQESTPDRRTYEERTLEELRERAGQLQLEGRSAMNKDELIAALRQHSR
jgi:pyruvate/2-oxoglutarate dehydrogenase complex dihydrolipoamide acyltransferase (E2) component